MTFLARSHDDPVVALSIDFDGRVITVHGREAWALHILIVRGELGATPIDAVGPRWSNYLFLLRRSGIVIETIDEPHSGPFADRHARYVLGSPPGVVKITRASVRITSRKFVRNRGVPADPSAFAGRS
ncbi:winged helix domain-containing protein [Microvirga puerhi]|uniref:Winged helix domain-containing protein n=1 Tax=Microvirga puerhi TaxID=2876078 RepID=A0ABS7VJN5_9HYPH|nr:hypothetical protein [Microvirga puerhi]MBZ6075738.1 hypothetical protein [Microvirga puerhi]